MATEPSERETKLLAELEKLEAARDTIITGGQSSSMDGISKTNVNIEWIDKRIKQVNRSLQRERLGGRLIAVRVQNASPTSGTLPQYLQGG